MCSGTVRRRPSPWPFEVRVSVPDDDSIEELIQGMDALHRRTSSDQRQLFRLVAEADRREAWRDSGSRDMAAWLSARYGISDWKARRWIAAARALERLPGLAAAFSCGELGIDKVVELTRFAMPQTEAGLIAWARRVSGASVRRKADLAVRQLIDEVREADRSRSLSG